MAVIHEKSKNQHRAKQTTEAKCLSIELPINYLSETVKQHKTIMIITAPEEDQEYICENSD